MKIRRLGNKGILGVWLDALVSLFIVGTLFLITDDMMRNELAVIALDMGVPAENITNLLTFWTAFPFVMCFGILLYAVVRSQKQEYDTGWR